MDGVNDLPANVVDANTFMVVWVEDLGGVLLHEIGKGALSHLARSLGREDDFVSAVGVGHSLDIKFTVDDDPWADAES